MRRESTLGPQIDYLAPDMGTAQGGVSETQKVVSSLVSQGLVVCPSLRLPCRLWRAIKWFMQNRFQSATRSWLIASVH